MASPRIQPTPPQDAQARKEVVVQKQVSTPTHDQISELAYTYWLSRKPEDGSAEDDWFRAERALLASKA